MDRLRQNISLARVLVVLFVAQLFVPLAAAATRGDGSLEGIIICTSRGLRHLTPAGELVPVHDKGGQAAENCFVCLVGGCIPSVADKGAGFDTGIAQKRLQQVLRPAFVLPLSQITIFSYSARAPPLV